MAFGRVNEWIERLNWIASLPESERERLRAECAFEGHTPSGDYFLTANPIHICWHCGSKFYIDLTGVVMDNSA